MKKLFAGGGRSAFLWGTDVRTARVQRVVPTRRQLCALPWAALTGTIVFYEKKLVKGGSTYVSDTKANVVSYLIWHGIRS